MAALSSTGPGRRPALDAAIDHEGLRLPASCGGVLDVFFDGRRIWSLDADGYPPDSGSRLIRWPQALHQHLRGSTFVSLRRHGNDDVLYETEVAFDQELGRVSVVDGVGRPIAIDKWDRAGRPLDLLTSDSRTSLLDGLHEVLRVLREECGVHPFLAYGTLLGAVREGGFIGHDNDLDVSYLGEHENPTDVVLESFRIERIFRRHGWRTLRDGPAFFKVFVIEPDGAPRNIDIFTSFFAADYYYLVPHVRALLSRGSFLPLGEVEFEGRRFPAPAHPPALLAAIYGDEWEVPNPAFRHRTPKPTRRRLGRGWVRQYLAHRGRWRTFYSGPDGKRVPAEPSGFARWVAERERTDSLAIDLGCGTGRDTVWFAQRGYTVLGLDYADTALNSTRAALRDAAVSGDIKKFNLYDLRQALAVGARLAHDPRPRFLHARFLVHALLDDAQEHLWRFTQLALRARGRLYLEFRTTADTRAQHAFGTHFRNYTDPDDVVARLEALDAHVEYRTEGYGLAEYGVEDPHVCRLVVSWLT